MKCLHKLTSSPVLQKTLLFSVLIVLSAVSQTFAQGELLSVPYTGKTIRVRTAPLHVTVIELDTNERIISIIVGDSERWRIQPTVGSGGLPLIVVKPTEANLKTNMIVTTSMRTYQFDLISVKEGAQFHSLVRFDYGGGEIIRVSPLPPSENDESTDASPAASQPQANSVSNTQKNNYYYGYSWRVENDFPWKPIAVYDDGRRTFIKIPDTASRYELPVLRILEDGNAVVVNYAVRDGMYIVDRIFRQAELVIGSEVRGGFLGLKKKQRSRKLIIVRRE